MSDKVSIRDASSGRSDVWKMDPRKIRERDGWNSRDDTPELREHIEGIAKSIATIGFLADKAIVVHQEDGEFWVSDGHCRLAGAMLAIKNGADIQTVPVVPEPRGSNEADRVAGMLTRNSGKPLTPLEQGKVYKRLQAFGWEDQKIADVSGKSPSHVKHIFTLMESTPETQAAVVAGEVSATTVAKAVKQHGATKAAEVVQTAIATAKKRGKHKATNKDVAPDTIKLGDGPMLSIPLNEESRERTSAAVVDFFRITLEDQDGTPSVRALSELVMRYKRNALTDEEFSHALNLQMAQ